MPPQQPYQQYPPQRPGWQPRTQPSGEYPYPSGGYQRPPTGQAYAPPQPPPAPKRRSIWPWVLLAIVLVPVLVVASCSALFVGGVNAVQDQRAGGTLPIGQTFTYKSGLAVGVADVAPTKVSNTYIVDKAETAYRGVVTVVNGTKTSASTVLLTINVTVGSVAAERVFDDGLPPTQDLAPGQQAKVPFKFKVKKGTKGPLQISVSPSLNEPVFFTGSLQ